MKKLAVFASGSGSNAENLIRFFAQSNKARVVLIVSSSASAFVLQRAESLNVPARIVTKKDMQDPKLLLGLLAEYNIDWVILAGYLLMVPSYLTQAYPNRIVNIHPALLPKYGGKGMYGDHVHNAVVQAKEQESGITIHFVNEHYDEGKIIFQAQCSVLPTDTPEQVAEKVHALEYKHYPSVVDSLL